MTMSVIKENINLIKDNYLKLMRIDLVILINEISKLKTTKIRK